MVCFHHPWYDVVIGTNFERTEDTTCVVKIKITKEVSDNVSGFSHDSTRQVCYVERELGDSLSGDPIRGRTEDAWLTRPGPPQAPRMATAASHYFVQHPLNPIRAARSSVCRAIPIPLRTALKLSRSEGKFIVTAATPGIKMENVSLELIGKRTLRLRVMNDENGDRHCEHIIRTDVMPCNPGTTPLQRSQPAIFAGIVSPAVAYFEAAPACTLEDASAAAAASANTSEAMPDAPPPTANAANEAAVPGSEELSVEEPLTKGAPGTSTHATDVKQPEQDTVREQMVVVLDKSICLPQHVDGAGIVCTYEEGRVRIEIPIADPKPDSEHELLMAKLRRDKEEAVAELARLEQAIKEQRDKVRDIHHAALNAAKAAAGPSLSCHIQRLAFTPHPHQ